MSPTQHPGRRVVAVIVHHRGLEMLETCLRSLLESERVALEVLVVLNHCLEDVPELARREPRVHLLETPSNLGFGEANNFGVAWARRQLGAADYWYFLNNDTESRPETLARLVDCLESEPAAAIAGPQTLIHGARGHLNSLGLNVTEDAWGWDEGIGLALGDYGAIPERHPVLAVTGSALLIEVGLFAEVGGWTELYDYYFEDIDLGIKTWKRGRQVWIEPAAVIYHRVSATMTVGAERKFFFFWRNRLLLAAVHWPFGKLLAVLRRALVDEIWARKRSESSLQRRAFWGAVRKLPGLLRWRWKLAGPHDWWHFLRPAGSVPKITLPSQERPRSGRDEAPIDLLAPAPAPELPAPEPILPKDWLEALDFPTPTRDGRRLLIFGWAPLPFENARFNAAPGARSWHFARALADAGHAVAMVLARIPGAYGDDADDVTPRGVALETIDGVRCAWLDRAQFDRDAELHRVVRAFVPDALIGAAPVPSLRACAVAGELPVWVDLFGDPIAEGQSRESVFPDVETFPAYARLLFPLLMRGDKISAVSERQRLAVIGQLGMVGRLRGDCAEYEFVEVLPCAAEADAAPDAGLQPHRGPGEPFSILWSGGFNTWCDVPTLLEALEWAMDRDPTLSFAATGGEIVGHDQRTAGRMAELAACSRHKDRIRLLGALTKNEADALTREADVTVVAERGIYERELGSSGRIAHWLALGKAIVCSDHSEIGRRLSERGLVFGYRAGDAGQLGERLLEVSRRRAELAAIGRAARAYAREVFAYGPAAGALLAWAADPRRSPDPGRQAEIMLRRDMDPPLAEAAARYALLAEELAAAESLIALQERQLAASETSYHALRGELGRIHQSRMWRWWNAGANLLRSFGRASTAPSTR